MIVGTDANGNINQWLVQAINPDLYLSSGYEVAPIRGFSVATGDTADAILTVNNEFGYSVVYAGGYNDGEPGIWTTTISGTDSPVPEPSSIALLSVGTIGGLCSLRKRAA
jgi:hypothetical protein